jgi:hypothetical protein
MLNNKASLTTVADFLFHLQIKQKLFLLVVTCVGACYFLLHVIVIDTEFSRTFYKYSI